MVDPRLRQRPLFITLDGVDGTGKTTAARLLAGELSAVYHKSPSGPFAAARARIDREASPLERCRFYSAACRYDSVVARAHLAAGRSVVADRYVASTYAYHVALDPACGPLVPFAELLVPDVAFLLFVDPAVRAGRLGARRPRCDARLEGDAAYLDEVEAIFRSLGLITLDTTSSSPMEIVTQMLAHLGDLETASASLLWQAQQRIPRAGGQESKRGSVFLRRR
jgi:dTMP kinase